MICWYKYHNAWYAGIAYRLAQPVQRYGREKKNGRKEKRLTKFHDHAYNTRNNNDDDDPKQMNIK